MVHGEGDPSDCASESLFASIWGNEFSIEVVSSPDAGRLIYHRYMVR